MWQQIWKPFKQGLAWIGVVVGITAGLVALQNLFALSRLEIIVSLGFLGIGLLGYIQLGLLTQIRSGLQSSKSTNNPSNPQYKPGQQPPTSEKPTGSGAVGGAVIGGIIGSLISPGPGTIIGGILGALIGNKIEYDDIQRKGKKK